MDRLAPDVHVAADGILDRGVIGVELDQFVGAALGDQFDVAVDRVGDLFGARHETSRYRGAASASARSSAVVTGRSHTRPRHT
ncbi:hypothetical protein A9X05_10680 [Mycobacterium sp. E3298]|nr:hypothetical protein A9X05_10680 [Mycobacterium sp. E3298]